MELMNYVRFKESKVEPNLKNHSHNCAVYAIIMESRLNHDHVFDIQSYKDVKDSMFKLKILFENSVSHFDGTPYEGGSINHAFHNKKPAPILPQAS